MIFTPTYIKMMSESPINKGNWDEFKIPLEQRIEWKSKEGQWVHHKTIDYVRCLNYRDASELEITEKRIWLPTSDDWWEMIDLEKFSFVEVFKDEFGFVLFAYDKGRFWSRHDFKGNSMLELLSAFYHFERWGMRWEGEKWRE